jgi:hypothetical protein
MGTLQTPSDGLPSTERKAAVTDFVAATRAFAVGTIHQQEMRHEALAGLRCADGLRDEECDALGVPRGSSVAYAAQAMLNAMDRERQRNFGGVVQALAVAQATVDTALAEIDLRKGGAESRTKVRSPTEMFSH